MGWDRKFTEPIPLPKGKPLATLRDAALYITKLPKAEHDAEEWLGRDGSVASRCRTQRPDNVRTYLSHACVEPANLTLR
jgi:hypothetical protein